jgi:3-(3-hydroxy-phenyl)propionate hydroxylase
MILFSSILGKLIMSTHRSIALLRDGFFRGIVQHILPMRVAIEEMRVKPQPRYSQGFLLPPDSRENRTYRGRLLPQSMVTAADGKQILLDEVLGNSFALFKLYDRLYDKPTQECVLEGHEIWQRLGVRCVDVDASKMGAFFEKKRDVYILIRPDKYIMGAFKAVQLLLQRR